MFRRPDHEMPLLPVVRSRQSRVVDIPHRSQGPLSLITLNILGGMTWGEDRIKQKMR